MDLMGIFVDYLAVPLSGLVGLLIVYATVLLHKRIQLINHEYARDKASDILWRVSDEARNAVKVVAQTYTNDIKAARADGKLTEEEKREALNRAKQVMFTHLGQAGLRELEYVVEDVNTYIENMIEGALADLK